jgi:hypothetical protein
VPGFKLVMQRAGIVIDDQLQAVAGLKVFEKT